MPPPPPLLLLRPPGLVLRQYLCRRCRCRRRRRSRRRRAASSVSHAQSAVRSDALHKLANVLCFMLSWVPYQLR